MIFHSFTIVPPSFFTAKTPCHGPHAMAHWPPEAAPPAPAPEIAAPAVDPSPSPGSWVRSEASLGVPWGAVTFGTRG